MNDLESKISRLRRDTEGLGPQQGFTERVLIAVDRDHARSFGAGVVRFGRTMLAIAALSAVAGITFGMVNQRAADEAVATTFGEELDW